ncbi:high nitrogen upregulated cytochrome P450 monooxygenase 2 [Mycena sanguinolenta]|nr:high nitrogen upregulated cytochrome P450 monooxygenase 2 [Mycena sanguinolenta]
MHFSLPIWAAALGLINHFFFRNYEPSSANLPVILLTVQPVSLLVFIGEPFSFLRLLWSYFLFLGSLSLSIVAYRLSPFHPLAQYPGPVVGKVTKLWGLWKAFQGYKHLYHKDLHDMYGPYVRTGPNELSVIDVVAVGQILGHGGLDKGRYYESGRHSSTPPSIVGAIGEAHTAKRRVWNRALTSSAIRNYEPLVAKRASQLVSCLRDSGGVIDLVHWFDLFSLDVMGDLAFGGTFEMLRDGRDVDGLGERIQVFMTATDLSGHIPWIVNTLHLFPQVGRTIQEFNDFAQGLAIQRMKKGAVGTRDLWYHLADEAGLEKQKPSLEDSAADGVIAVIAASDTTALALSSVVWFLLSLPEYYQRVQQELDEVIVDGDDPLDVKKHQELHFLSACINESLRLHPPVPSKGGSRQIPFTQRGRSIAGRFIPPGTSVWTPPYALHRNPEYFSHPNQFLPERWLSGSNFERHDTSAFMPFSLGPANCVGQKFAKCELFLVLSILFKSFDLRFAHGFDNEAWGLTLEDHFIVTRGPLRVNLMPRHSTHV